MLYDLIILGGGPAGYIAAERAGAAGKSVLLFEKRNLGGVCLNEGCIPTKTLLCSAKLKNHAQDGKKYGVDIPEAVLNHKKAMQRKSKTIKKLVAGIKNKMEKYNVEIIYESAAIKQKTDEGFAVASGGNDYYGINLLIATGSNPMIVPIEGIDEAIETGFVLTNKEVLELDDAPEKMVIIGGGVIGLEIATYFNSAGTEVTVIEMLDKIGGNIDDDISEILKKDCEKAGIKFILEAKVNKIAQGIIYYEKDNEIHQQECDKALLSVGRKANIKEIGLDNIGVKADRGIIVDERMLTNVQGVYAAGDVTALSMLAHTAYRQAETAVNNILGKNDVMKYNAIPSVIYTDPEIAGVGMTLKEAQQKGFDAAEQAISMNYSGRYMAENEAGQGIAKIVVDKDTKMLLGVHMIGSYVSEIIYGAGIMIERGMTLDEIKTQIFPHPTVSEIIREAVFEIEI